MTTKPSLPAISRRNVLAGGIAAVPLVLGAASSGNAYMPPQARKGTLVLEPGRLRQTIRGFGGMTHAKWIGDLTESQRNTAFDNGSNDLGLTILRIPVNEDRAHWALDLGTAKAAAAKGALVFASPWNPPADLVEYFNHDGGVPQGSQYEAEAGVLVNAHVATDHAGYQGGGYVQFDAPSAASVQFNDIVIGSSGTKNLAFRYTAPTGDVQVDIYVAGALVAAGVTFSATAAGTWAWKSIQAQMTPGKWPVKVVTTGSGGPALDYLMAAAYTPPGSARRLRYDAYGAYAQHLNDFVHYMRDNGVELYGISIQNEPDYAHTWTWWTTEELNRFLRDYAGQIDARIIAPESYQYVKSVSDPILNDPAALANVDIIGAHLYGTKYQDFTYPLFQEKGAGKELWMTEVYYPNSSSSANLWPEALRVAEHVHHSLADAEFQSYVWWYIRRGYGPILEDGSISKRGYMIAHFTKFVRPGYARIDTTKEPQAGVLTSAYIGNDGQVVVVAVNTTADAVTQPITLDGTRVRQVRSWVTDSIRSLEKQTDISGTGNGFTAALPAQSVTTFVLNA